MDELSIGLSLLALSGTIAALVRSAPARLVRDARQAVEAADHVEAQWHAERANLTAFKIEMTVLLDTISKKAKSLATAESRAAKRENGHANEGSDLAAMSSDEIRAHYTNVARERGLL